MSSSCGTVFVVVVALVVLQTSLAQEEKPSLPIAGPYSPLIVCPKGCELVIGSDGCQKCACQPSCENTVCAKGYYCQLQCSKICCRPICVPFIVLKDPVPA